MLYIILFLKIYSLVPVVSLTAGVVDSGVVGVVGATGTVGVTVALESEFLEGAAGLFCTLGGV